MLWRSALPTINQNPGAPSGLTASATAEGAVFSWQAAADAQTATGGLSYNLRVGTVPGGGDVISPQSETGTGVRRVPALGNAQTRLNALARLPVGRYYWSVQAVDSAFAGSPFAPEATFDYTTVPTATTLPATDIGPVQATLNASVQTGFLPTTVKFEYGKTTNYGSVSAATNLPAAVDLRPIGTTLTNLEPATTYHFRVTAQNGAGSSLGLDGSFTTPGFENLNTGLPALALGSVAVGDCDNDGRLDILLSGKRQSDGVLISQVWRNLGDGSFTNLDVGLPGAWYGSVAWGDYDRDGDLDILLTGATNFSGALTQVWRNVGQGGFTHVPVDLPGVEASAAVWADFDNDGLPDILLAGTTDGGFTALTQVWRNQGNDTFTNLNAGLTAIWNASVAVGDCDNDGYLDIAMIGLGIPGSITAQVWRNQGNGTFTNLNVGLPGHWLGSTAWGDYDNDGRLDLLLSGRDEAGYASCQLWHNLGGGAFTKLTATGLPSILDGTATWGDFDNDGRLDVLLAGFGAGREAISQVWRNQGDGTFTHLNAGLTGVAGVGVCGDFDSDGRLDILTAGAQTDFTRTTMLWRSALPAINQNPGAPSGLTASATAEGAVFSWQAAADAQTATGGLS
jgi:hypothetical protein